MSKNLTCWTRERNDKTKYITCLEGQKKKSSNNNMRRNRNRTLDNRPTNLIPNPTENYNRQLQQDYIDRTMEETGMRNLEEFYNVSGITSNPSNLRERIGDYYVDSSGFRVIDNRTQQVENPNKLRDLVNRLNYIMGDKEISDYISTLGFTGELLDKMYSDLMGRMYDMEEYDDEAPHLDKYIRDNYKSQRGVRTTYTKLDDDANYPDEFLREIENYKFSYPVEYTIGDEEEWRTERSEMDYLDYSGDIRFPTEPLRHFIPNRAWYEALNRAIRKEQEQKKNIRELLQADEELDYDILPIDVSRGSTQRRVEAEDRRQQFLQRDTRNRFLDASNQREQDRRRREFSRTLSNPTEFVGSTQEDKYGDKFNPPLILDPKSPKSSGRTPYTRERGISQLLTNEYLSYMGLPKRPVRRHGTTGYIRGDGSMEEMTYLLDDMEENPDKYIGTSYGRRIKEHMNKYNTAYYYGLRRQLPQFKNDSKTKGQHEWNKRSNKMKELLNRI